MADICVFFLSDDRALVRSLVAAIGTRYSVWWSDELIEGDWEERVRKELRTAKAIIPVISENVKKPRAAILFDEILLARKLKVPIVPFRIGDGDLPLGLGRLTEVVSLASRVVLQAAAVSELRRRLDGLLAGKQAITKTRGTKNYTPIGSKLLELPAFIFSASSFETQIAPQAAVELLNVLRAEAILVSAYDVWTSLRDRKAERLCSSLRETSESPSILILDSGNYEAARIRAVVPKGSRFRWSRASFHKVCRTVRPDAAFSFDTIPKATDPRTAARAIVAEFRLDQRAIGRDCKQLWPIVHLPRDVKPANVPAVAADLVVRVARALKAHVIAVPERELGPNLRARIESVTRIRSALDAEGQRFALHILGTGNPIAINALAAAGADSFDGLEWCRTVTNYDPGFLFHFRHLDLFEDSAVRRVRGDVARQLLRDSGTPYEIRALALNVDYWQDLARSTRSLLHASQRDVLIRSLPLGGEMLFRPAGGAT